MMKKTVAAVFFIFSIFGITGCNLEAKGETGVKTVEAQPVYPEKIDEEDGDARRAFWEENQISEEFLLSQKDFAYKTAGDLLGKECENALISPVSLYYAISLATAGTAGDTAKELHDFLETADQETAADEVGKLYRSLYSYGSGDIGKLRIATSLWQDKTLKLKPEFLDQAAENYYSSVYSVDFEDEKTSAEMGAWVAEQTSGTITPSISTQPLQVLSILNTVYYYDEWMDQFRRTDTKEDLFYLQDGSSVNADFMNRKYGSHGFTKGDNYTRSALSLKGGGTMVFVLPDEGTSLSTLTESAVTMKEAMEGGSGQMGEVIFKLPKFKMDCKIDIKEMMEGLGITKLFTDGDFSAMTETGDISVAKISQDTQISVNEDGVEASAFTEILYSGAAMPKGRADMVLNRPFLYGISVNGTWLFLGTCYVPQRVTQN